MYTNDTCKYCHRYYNIMRILYIGIETSGVPIGDYRSCILYVH